MKKKVKTINCFLFHINDDKLLGKYKTIWTKIKNYGTERVTNDHIYIYVGLDKEQHKNMTINLQ